MKRFRTMVVVLCCIILFSVIISNTGCTSSSKLLAGKQPEESTPASGGALVEASGKEAGMASKIESTNNASTAAAAGTAEDAAKTGAVQSTASDSAGSKPADTAARQGSDEPAKRFKAKALYLTGWTVGSMERVNHFIDIAKTTEINSYVIDIKDDDGKVGYKSGLPAVNEIGAWENKYDADKVIKAFHDNGVHIIGRLVAFKDPVLSSKKPELAVKNTSGGVWKDNNKLTWLDPYNKESWKYLVDIAKEAVGKGFDEIQFDYMRFPNDGDKKGMSFSSNGKTKYDAINEFLAYAKSELPGTIVSADVFGIICESPADTEDIGQYLELIGKDVDYISPMVYPSHYAAGQEVNKVVFPKPDLDPYNVVYHSLVKAKDRIAKSQGYKAAIRPYLQDFTASWLKKGYYQSYGPDQVRQQIKAVYDAGLDEWILWDAGNTYSEGALNKENQKPQ